MYLNPKPVHEYVERLGIVDDVWLGIGMEFVQERGLGALERREQRVGTDTMSNAIASMSQS